MRYYKNNNTSCFYVENKLNILYFSEKSYSNKHLYKRFGVSDIPLIISLLNYIVLKIATVVESAIVILFYENKIALESLEITSS